jgi:DNA-binding transcriptional MerR regulator
MLRIGEFSRLSGVSIKALRYYDEIGLLSPARIDAVSGYRQYDSAQLTIAHHIVALKDLGFSLAEIVEAASGGDLHSFLQNRRRELARDIAVSRERLRRIDALLAHEAISVDVVMRRTPSRLGVSLRAIVGSYEEADQLFAEARERLPLQQRDAERGALWHQCDPEARRIDCEVFYLIEGHVPPGFQRVSLPAVDSALVLYTGSEWHRAYRALDEAMRANGWQMAGPKLERYLLEDVTELSVPVKRISC